VFQAHLVSDSQASVVVPTVHSLQTADVAAHQEARPITRATHEPIRLGLVAPDMLGPAVSIAAGGAAPPRPFAEPSMFRELPGAKKDCLTTETRCESS